MKKTNLRKRLSTRKLNSLKLSLQPFYVTWPSRIKSAVSAD